MIKTILLDLDGPLLDGKARHYQCYADILNAHGYSAIDIDAYWNMKRNRMSRREQLALSNAEPIYEEFLREWIQRIEQPEYLSLDQIQAGAIIKLQEWNRGRLSVVLVTMRKNRENLLEQLRVNGLIEHLSSVLVCDYENGGTGKAEAVMSKFPDIQAGSCLWIGDTEVDLEGARYLGCQVWLLSCGLRTRPYLQSLDPDFLSGYIADVDTKKVA